MGVLDRSVDKECLAGNALDTTVREALMLLTVDCQAEFRKSDAERRGFEPKASLENGSEGGLLRGFTPSIHLAQASCPLDYVRGIARRLWYHIFRFLRIPYTPSIRPA